MLHPVLEKISSKQSEIGNQLWLLASEIAIHKGQNSKIRARRKSQLSDLKKSIDIDSPRPGNKAIMEQWWKEETLWIESILEDQVTPLAAGLTYRFLVTFYKNHALCPFTEVKKNLMLKECTVADARDFESANQSIFEECVELSLQIIPTFPCLPVKSLLSAFESLSNEDLDKNLYSARHKLLNRDIEILKGIAIGGSVGVATSVFAGPIIGTWIGEMAGLSGAAATSYGLALLGGGSLASGGLGMAGGSTVLGIAFAGTSAFYSGKSELEIQILDLVATAKNLPILLAVGRTMKEQEWTEFSWDIREVIEKAKIDHELRLRTLERDLRRKDLHKRAIQSLKDNLALYQRAIEMSTDYDWISGYDLLRRVL